MNGEYPQGSRIKEEELAELYAVSRGPVREAFRLLERRGFIEIVRVTVRGCASSTRPTSPRYSASAPPVRPGGA